MPDFKIDTGHDLDLVDLNTITPYDPWTVGLQYGRFSYAASGIVVAELPYYEFIFPILTEAEVQALLTLCGLTGAIRTADVTIYAQDINLAWQIYNGVAVRPETLKRHGYYFYDVPILIKDLRAQA